MLSRSLVNWTWSKKTQHPIEAYWHANQRTLCSDMPIVGHCSDSDQKTLLTCQSKDIWLTCQSKDTVQMPIEGHCWHANRKTLDHHSKKFIFFRQVFVTTHVRENLGKHERENFGVQHLTLHLHQFFTYIEDSPLQKKPSIIIKLWNKFCIRFLNFLPSSSHLVIL